MKPGRNDPCPCGSGKKYKKCCIEKDAPAPAPIDFALKSVELAADGLPREIMRWAEQAIGDGLKAVAWTDFNLGDEAVLDADSPHLQVFGPWYLYDWRPEPGDIAALPDPGAPAELGIAAGFLSRGAGDLVELEKRYVWACIETPFSFHEIVRVDPGNGFVFRDIMTDDEACVTERRGSMDAEPANFFFGKVVRLDGVALLDGCSAFFFEPREKQWVLDLRKTIREKRKVVSRAALREHEVELLEIYHDLMERRLHPVPPVMQNTDGDLLRFHTLVYDITSPREAFDALKGLALGRKEADLLVDAARGEGGALVKASIPWLKRGNKLHKHWSYTGLGTIDIDGGTLTVEVNSAERAEKFRAVAEKRLKGIARHRATTMKSVEEGMAELKRQQAAGGPTAKREEHERLMQDPEVRARLADFLARDYDDWADSPLPILGGKTPREAVKDPEGREMVETLLASMERKDGKRGMPPLGPVFVKIRKKLGL